MRRTTSNEVDTTSTESLGYERCCGTSPGFKAQVDGLWRMIAPGADGGDGMLEVANLLFKLRDESRQCGVVLAQGVGQCIHDRREQIEAVRFREGAELLRPSHALRGRESIAFRHQFLKRFARCQHGG